MGHTRVGFPEDELETGHRVVYSMHEFIYLAAMLSKSLSAGRWCLLGLISQAEMEISLLP